jgi:ubiquitin-protein ligase
MKANKRKEKDVMKLLTSDYDIEIKNDNMSEFTVILEGPPDSPYEGVRILLNVLQFVNIYHAISDIYTAKIP